MKGYFISEEMLFNLVRNLRDDLRNPYRAGSGARVSDEEIVKDILRESKTEPIEINDITVSMVNTPCKYYLKSNIVGFTQESGRLLGVFITE